jgi:hypothetical protein
VKSASAAARIRVIRAIIGMGRDWTTLNIAYLTGESVGLVRGTVKPLRDERIVIAHQTRDGNTPVYMKPSAKAVEQLKGILEDLEGRRDPRVALVRQLSPAARPRPSPGRPAA